MDNLHFVTAIYIKTILPLPTTHLIRPMQTEINSKRLALIIGNSFYDAFPKLENANKDAGDVEVKLKSFGFAVDLSVERTTRDMLQDISSFTKRIHHDVTDIVFYYAGHGCGIRK